MSDNRIKVAGYSQRIVYTNGIEYRPFSPDLVGQQFATENSAPLFTMGNFNITTNIDPKVNKTFITKDFSDFVTLADLKLTVENTDILLQNNAIVVLNLDKTKLKNYALFGSLNEFVRVSLENIIIKWPASLFVDAFYLNTNNEVVVQDTFENLIYDALRDESSFRIDTNLIENKFGINYLENGSIANTFSETNDTRNLTVNYLSYTILVEGVEYDVIGFTGSTFLTNDFIYFNVKGEIFSGLPTTTSYHIKPNITIVNLFFNSLNNFESYLLNRMTVPLYTAIFDYPIKSDSGEILYITTSVTWPVTDGYNIDFDSGEYISYVTDLLTITDNYDQYQGNLMNRFLVSESITSFDTVPLSLTDEELDTSGQKVNKLLNIYGRSFDDIENFISGVAFANFVSYDKKDNIPDYYIKNLAKVLGWEVITSITNNDLLTNYIQAGNSTYSGHSVGLTPVEADNEMWRRLIINSPWIWKSKGTRKVIDFIAKFIGSPRGLLRLNEYIYKADAPIDIDLFTQALELNGLPTSLEEYPFDEDGFPSFTGDTDDMYFQNYGQWYRETGGNNAIIDVTSGNNPHAGPYDGGFKFIKQFTTLIPNFSAVTIHNETSATTSFNLFTNYNLGEITNYSGATYVDVLNEDNTTLRDCVVVTANVIHDYKPVPQVTECGCISSEDDDILNICIKKITPPTPIPCEGLASPPIKDNNRGLYVFNLNQYNSDGTLYTLNGQPISRRTIFTSRECCKSIYGTSSYTDSVDLSNGIVSSGYACCFANTCGCSIACDWILNPNTYKFPVSGASQGQYCEFTTLFGQGVKKVTLPDSSNCPSTWTVAVPNIIDPYTGDVGFGCKITPTGLSDFARLTDYFKKKSEGGYTTYTCCLFTRDIYLKYFPRI